MIREELINPQISWAYFDGAYDAQIRCSVGLVVHIINNIILKSSLGIGPGKNNYAKIFSLKLLLCWVREIGLASVQAFGDPLSVVNWFNVVHRCQNHALISLIE